MAKVEHATKQDLKNLESSIDKKFAEQTKEITSIIRGVVDEVSDLKEEIIDMKQEIIDLKVSHDRLLNTLDEHYKAIKDIQIENHARDAELARLKAWAVQVSKETGVKLEY